MTTPRRFDLDAFADWACQSKKAPHARYYAMYSSVFEGMVTDPALMMVPVDDHLVHRGDGVFESLKCVGGGIYNLKAHMERLSSSVQRIGLALPVKEDRLMSLVVETVRAGGQPDCAIRVLVSRGPGSLGVNPYDCPRSELYIIAGETNPPFMTVYPHGARARLSAVPVKPGFFANIKSCNYLPNVLMKKEAVDAGIDFVISVDEEGHLGESAVESVALVNRDRELLFPETRRILSGTTSNRAAALAKQLVTEGLLTTITQRALTPEDARDSREFLVLGTTPDVAAVTEFEGQPVGDGAPGPVSSALGRLLAHDIEHNPAMRTMALGPGS